MVESTREKQEMTGMRMRMDYQERWVRTKCIGTLSELGDDK